jgi:hypothetical protein
VGGGREIESSRPAQEKVVIPYLKNRIKKGWEDSLSGRALA